MAIILGALLVMIGNKKSDASSKELIMVIGFLIIIVSVAISIAATLGGFRSPKAECEEILVQNNKWKNEYAKPFIKNLPNNKEFLRYIKINESRENNVFDDEFEDKYSNPITISYLDEGNLVTKSVMAEIKMTLSPNEKAYIIYKEVKKDLGLGLKKGFYEAKVYFPYDYNLNGE